MRGAWTAVRRILVSAAWKTALKDAVKFDRWSRIRNLTSSNRSLRPRARLRACCTVHSPEGFALGPAALTARGEAVAVKGVKRYRRLFVGGICRTRPSDVSRCPAVSRPGQPQCLQRRIE